MVLEIYMDKSLAEIVEFFLNNQVLDFSKKDVADQTEVSRTTVQRKWSILEKTGFIKKTRKYQNTQLYKIDEDSEIVNHIGRLERDLKRALSKEDAKLFGIGYSTDEIEIDNNCKNNKQEHEKSKSMKH